MEGFRIDLQPILGLTMPNQYSQTVRKQISSWFGGANFELKSSNLHNPYIVLLLYDNTVMRNMTEKYARLPRVHST